MHTYESYRLKYGDLLLLIENITVALFCVDYILRLCTAKYMYPESKGPGAVRKYIFSFTGIIDMLSFPALLSAGVFPFGGSRVPPAESHADIPSVPDQCLLQFFPAHNRSIEQQKAAALFFSIYDSHSHARLQPVHVQPGTRGSAGSIHQCILRNLVGGVHTADCRIRRYLSDYHAGKNCLGIFITFLGVGMVAIPTGIISAGFVDQYSRIKRNERVRVRKPTYTLSKST